jgi:acyl-CoA thioesterase I
MIGSGMSGEWLLMVWSRRDWLSHCSVLAVALAAGRAAAAPGARTILIVGDSLSAEYGLKRGSGWVALLEQRLQRERIDATLINASISGDTTSGGRSRLPELLRQHKPTHVLIELGGNDALRGLPLDLTRGNLVEMGRAASASGTKVMLIGMQVPPNYGRKYSDDFAKLFVDVAKQERTALVPFLLKGVADGPRAFALFQPDRIHPTEEAQTLMLDNVWPVLKPLLK